MFSTNSVVPFNGLGAWDSPDEYKTSIPDEIYGHQSLTPTPPPKKSLWDTIFSGLQKGADIYATVKGATPGGNIYNGTPPPPPSTSGMSATKIILAVVGVAAVGGIAYAVLKPKKKK